MKESLRYLDNAKEILKKVPIEGRVYTDVKPVREAFGTAYLAILEAINEYLITKRGLTKKELPKLVVSKANPSVDAYRMALQKTSPFSPPYEGGEKGEVGKLMREFENLYDAMHIAGYYRGLIYDVNAVKDYLKAAAAFIEKIR